MPGQFRVLTALPVALLAVLAGPASAWAHNPRADYEVLPGGKVQVDAWFDPGATPMRMAKVDVYHGDGLLLTQGKTDDKGTFTFSFGRAEPLRVVVSAAGGHRTEFRIPLDKLTSGETNAEPSTGPSGAEEQTAVTPRQPIEHTSSITVKDVLVGVGFLLALAAFVLSVRNARQLRRWRARAKQARAGTEEESMPR
jgi:hypothetical protein